MDTTNSVGLYKGKGLPKPLPNKSYQRKIAKLAKKGMRCFMFIGKYNELYYSRNADFILGKHITAVGKLPQGFVDSISNTMTETDDFVVVSLYDNKATIQTNSLPNTGFA